jgi:SAM-dependent methyltransferase
MSTRWQNTDAPRGDDYDARWRALAAQGESVHGEADLVDTLLRESGGTRVLDAGCGTGRVAIELAARGYRVAGVDVDSGMLSTARAKAPDLTWLEADLTDLSALSDEEFDLVVLAGNVMIFVDPGSEGAVLEAAAGRLSAGGILVGGFSVRPDRLPLKQYDDLAEAAGLYPVARWSTWSRDPYTGGDYAVSVHARTQS